MVEFKIEFCGSVYMRDCSLYLKSRFIYENQEGNIIDVKSF